MAVLQYSTVVLLLISTLHIFQFSNTLPVSDRNPFVGFYVFPHGGVILDPMNTNYSYQPAFSDGSKEKAINLHNAMIEAAEALMKMEPELIIFSSPHGLRLDDKPLILFAHSARGKAGDGVWDNFTASFEMETELSVALYSELRGAGHSIELLSLGSGYETIPLIWAEVIPWYYIREAAIKLKLDIPKAIYIGQPPAINRNDLQSIGRDMIRVGFLRKDFASKKIAVVVSGDLSHYHSKDPKAPYGFSSIASIFDNQIVNWAKMDINENKINASAELLIDKAGTYESQAGPCAYAGLLMLQGMLNEMVNQKWNLKATFYAYEVPSYFGMVVTGWVPENN